MNKELTKSMIAIRDLKKAYVRFAEGKPNSRQAKKNANEAFYLMLNHLDQDINSINIDKLINEGRSNLLERPDEIWMDMEKRYDKLISVEIQLAKTLQLKRKEVEEMMNNFRQNRKDSEKYVSNFKELKQILIESHNQTMEEIVLLRDFPRKLKKNRKKNVRLGIINTVIGTGLIVANTQIPTMSTISYGLGGSTVLKGINDFLS